MPIATATMTAVRIHRFGGPDVLSIEEMPVPRPGPGEVLVWVHAAGVNPVDWKIREGRLDQPPLPLTLGNDFSGVIEETGPGSAEFMIGDAVFGHAKTGSYAEYALAAIGSITRKPAELDYARAAALPVAAETAWQALVDVADLRPGQTVLIHAAAGGVGSFAVQFAKLRGARVYGTASSEHAQEVRRLGADEVIDYRATRFETAVKDIDVVLDTIGGDTQERSLQVLRPGGILVSLVQPPAQELAAARGVRAVIMRRKPAPAELSAIADLVVSGRVIVPIFGTFPLQEARRAQELSQQGHVFGKIILVVRPDAERA
jgi:NADPH:quinone reductase-like Zn-dependent oxidoreductase